MQTGKSLVWPIGQLPGILGYMRRALHWWVSNFAKRVKAFLMFWRIRFFCRARQEYIMATGQSVCSSFTSSLFSPILHIQLGQSISWVSTRLSRLLAQFVSTSLSSLCTSSMSTSFTMGQPIQKHIWNIGIHNNSFPQILDFGDLRQLLPQLLLWISVVMFCWLTFETSAAQSGDKNKISCFILFLFLAFVKRLVIDPKRCSPTSLYILPSIKISNVRF